jgi:hypothetical protein
MLEDKFEDKQNKQQMQDEQKEQKEFVYNVENGEDLVDPAVIANCKLEQNRDIIENARLGSYDKYGNYVFIPAIRFELINIPKFIYNVSTHKEKNTENVIKVFDLRSIIPIFGDLFFKLTLSDKEAVLYIVETVTRESGNYVEVYEEVVDAIALGKMSTLTTEDILAMYHIYENDDNNDEQRIYLYDFSNILIRKIYLSLLASELNEQMKPDEHNAFSFMIATLKEGGEYGERVLSTFVNRMKDRPEIFGVEDTQKYNRAVNEVLLSSLDIATTEADKESPVTKEIYFKVLNARNQNVENYIESAHKNIEKDYVLNVARSATKDFNEKILKQNTETETQSATEDQKALNKDIVSRFYDRLVKGKTAQKVELQKAILKQGKQLSQPLQKETAQTAKLQTGKPKKVEGAILATAIMQETKNGKPQDSAEQKSTSGKKSASKSGASSKSASKQKSSSKGSSGSKSSKSTSSSKKSSSSKSTSKTKSSSSSGSKSSVKKSNTVKKKLSSSKTKVKSGGGKAKSSTSANKPDKQKQNVKSSSQKNAKSANSKSQQKTTSAQKANAGVKPKKEISANKEKDKIKSKIKPIFGNIGTYPREDYDINTQSQPTSQPKEQPKEQSKPQVQQPVEQLKATLQKTESEKPDKIEQNRQPALDEITKRSEGSFGFRKEIGKEGKTKEILANGEVLSKNENNQTVFKNIVAQEGDSSVELNENHNFEKSKNSPLETRKEQTPSPEGASKTSNAESHQQVQNNEESQTM